MKLTNLFYLFHTIYFLKPVQIYWRVYLRFKNKCPDRPLPVSLGNKKLSLVAVNERPVSYLGNGFTFLNHTEIFDTEVDWQISDQEKLWTYNLHYFDYLQQTGMDNETGIKLMQGWCQNIQPCSGDSWEPYPLALRMVNWIKFIGRTESTDHQIYASLYKQSRSLRNQLEFHLLGNHLFKNAVALLFAGRFFSGDEADEWYQKGRKILIEQTEEQVLSDGGHFERSPMYHALILEDILDCLNLIRSTNEFEDPGLEKILMDKAHAMLGFIDDIQHPDGSLPFFNDTAQGIASTAEQLFSYARRLNLEWQKNENEIIEKPDVGLYIFSKNNWRLIIDAGAIGPDYLPGHAHCDTLSYELCLDGTLVIVNAGVYQYAGMERNIYRATRSHNTLEIDQAEQHEIWSTFRVARRGYPRNVSVRKCEEELLFSGQHTGYQRLKGKPLHQRNVNLTEDYIQIVDRVIGKGEHSVRSFIHFHPDIEIVSQTDHKLHLQTTASTFCMNIPEDLQWAVDDYEYSPEFGLKQKANVVIISRDGRDDFSFSYEFRSL